VVQSVYLINRLAHKYCRQSRDKDGGIVFKNKSATTKDEEKLEVKLYVGNMSYDTTEDQLRTLFAEAGEVLTVDVIKDRYSGSPKGFAFITMGNQADANKAITMFNGKEVGGRPLTVNTAKPREDRPPGGGRSFNGPNRGNSNRRF